jgi:hypothetical protein
MRQRAIGNTANVALLMTSCFSGGWVIKTARDESKALLNATVMAAAGPDTVSESSQVVLGQVIIELL